LLIFVLMLFTLDRNRGLWPASGYPLMMMVIMMFIRLRVKSGFWICGCFH